jgi:hypothetical protein
MKLKKADAIHVPMFLFLVILYSCGQQSNTAATEIDSLSIQRDSTTVNVPIAVVEEPRDPNVYEIPSDYPWLLKLIGERFPWDSASECSRMKTYDLAFDNVKAKKEQIEHDLVTVYTYNNSFIKVATYNEEEMQDCMDNVCQVKLTSDWVGIGMGLHIGTSKSEFLEALGLDKNSQQNIYNYQYKPKDSDASVAVVFEFKDDALSSFTYELSPCSSYKIRVPQAPFFARLFNNPFPTMHPDSVKNAIGVHVRMGVNRNNEETFVTKVNSSDDYVRYEFDSSTVTFQKRKKWELTHMNLKSPNFSFINGVKVGMTRDEFLKTMGEKDFEGDEFYQINEYCNEGYNSTNNLRIFFAEGVIREIKYGRSSCR